MLYLLESVLDTAAPMGKVAESFKLSTFAE
jgi:hypothetical protein